MLNQAKKEDTNDLAFSYLTSYIKLQQPNYLFGKHHILMAKHLMWVEQGIVDRLIIAMPPRHGKTWMASTFFPAWYLGRNPDHEIISATYSFDRGTDVGRMVRNQLQSDIFKNAFPGCTLSKDSKGSNKLSTDQGGNYYSVGVGGGATGRGASVFIIDDPIKNREEAESETVRRRLVDFYKSVAYTRLTPDGRIVVIATRWHYDDLTGYLIEEDPESWTVLKFPAIAEEDEKKTGRKKGDALWPERYPLDRLEQIKSVVGSREWNSLYQQEPVNEEGAIVKLSWFQKYDETKIASFEIGKSIKEDEKSQPPFDIIQLVISWDTAFKESEINTPSCATIWGVSKIGYYLINIFNKQINFPKLKKKAIYLYNHYNQLWGLPVVVLIEDKASGQSLIQVLSEETSIPIIKIPAEVGKVIRMQSVTNVIEAGRVYIPNNANWMSMFERQMGQFPLGKHKDIVDSTSQFLRWVAKPRLRKRKLMFWK